jgi:hypothetical protein
LALAVGAQPLLAQDFYFGEFEDDVQSGGQFILDQNEAGYAGWFDWSFPETPRPTYSPVTPETTLGVTGGTYSMPWRPAGDGFDQGLATKVQDLPAATRDSLFAGFLNNTHLAMNVTYNNDEWFDAYNGVDWNGNEVQMYVNYGGETIQFLPLGLPDGRPDIDTGNPGEHTGRWDIDNYGGVTTRVMMWDYSSVKDDIQALYNSNTVDETNGTLEFVMSTSHGNFDLGGNPPFTSPAFYVDRWRFTNPNPVPGNVTNYQLPDAAAWPGTPAHVTTTTSANLQTDFNVEVSMIGPAGEDPGGAASHTFTPTENMTLDGFAIRAAGAPVTGELYLYRNPQAGGDADGFVNHGTPENPLNEGVLINALPFTFDGTETRTFLVFDLLEGAEVTLEAGVEYSIDLRNTDAEGDTMYWMRAGTTEFLNAYDGGNIYARNPIEVTAVGERFAVAGAPRDGTLALYTELPPNLAVLIGDYNGDGKVSAADYTVWRDHIGADTLANRDPDNEGPVGGDDYDSWLANYGSGNFGAGAGSFAATASVPEPATLALTILAICLGGLARRR